MERYVVWPGQACSYMIGQLRIVELREQAKKALGHSSPAVTSKYYASQTEQPTLTHVRIV